VPCFIGLALVGHDLVLLLLGPGWAESAWPLALLALGGIPHASNYLVATAANARGRPDAVLGASLRIAGLRLGASLAAAPLGLVAVAVANLLVTMLSTWLLLRGLRGVVPGAWSAIRQGAGPALAAGAAMAACVLGLGLALGDTAPALRLGAEVLAGMAAYPAALWLVAPPALRGRLRTALLRRSAGRPAVSRS
jgi:O-antigen/teichoic acid export membrane protein